jgi:hypothetical protein
MPDLPAVSHSDLTYSGERHMTGLVGVELSLGQIEHMVRYAAVAPFVAGKRVLDARWPSARKPPASASARRTIEGLAPAAAAKTTWYAVVASLQAACAPAPRLTEGRTRAPGRPPSDPG